MDGSALSLAPTAPNNHREFVESAREQLKINSASVFLWDQTGNYFTNEFPPHKVATCDRKVSMDTYLSELQTDPNSHRPPPIGPAVGVFHEGVRICVGLFLFGAHRRGRGGA